MATDTDLDLDDLREVKRLEQEFINWADRLREKFGVWDPDDPAARAILKLVEAQNHLADEISKDATTGDGDIGEALEMRAWAATEVMTALLIDVGSIWTPQAWRKHPIEQIGNDDAA